MYSARHEGKRVEDLSDLTRYSVDGEKAIVDPWGNRFRFRYTTDPESGKERYVVWTVNPTTGKVLAIPREAAAQIEHER